MSILVVEDNNDFRELLCEMLRMLGHSVSSEASAEHALNAWDANKPDLVITDLTLPGMSGMEFAKQLHGLNPETKIILSSGYGLPAGPQLDFKVGVLSKPYSLNQLIQALNQFQG
ncbi:MAG: response regulator [Burkholderiaceae bacterium]